MTSQSDKHNPFDEGLLRKFLLPEMRAKQLGLKKKREGGSISRNAESPLGKADCVWVITSTALPELVLLVDSTFKQPICLVLPIPVFSPPWGCLSLQSRKHISTLNISGRRVYTIFPICTPRSTFTLLHLVTYPRRLT
jgi:hypothetical protein